MVGRFIQQQKLGGLRAPKHAGQGGLKTLAAAELRQRERNFVGTQLKLCQTGSQYPLFQRRMTQVEMRHDRLRKIEPGKMLVEISTADGNPTGTRTGSNLAEEGF